MDLGHGGEDPPSEVDPGLIRDENPGSRIVGAGGTAPDAVLVHGEIGDKGLDRYGETAVFQRVHFPDPLGCVIGKESIILS